MLVSDTGGLLSLFVFFFFFDKCKFLRQVLFSLLLASFRKFVPPFTILTIGGLNTLIYVATKITVHCVDAEYSRIWIFVATKISPL